MNLNFLSAIVTALVVIPVDRLYAQNTLPTPDPTKYKPIDCQSLSNYYNKWITFDNVTCYRLPHSYYDDATTWHEARTICLKYNATLVSIHNTDMNYLLAHRPTWTYNPSSTAFWIGLNSLVQRGVYKWSDGSGVGFTNFSNKTSNGDYVPSNVMDQGRLWITTIESDMHFFEGRCVSMRTIRNNSYDVAKDTGMWFKEDCNADRFYFCEKRMGSQVVPTQEPATPGNCPAGWTKYANEKCVQYVNYKMTKDQAVDKCNKMGGEILSIHSQDEQDFITAFTALNPEPYIGITRKSSSYIWNWPDQTDVSYTNWAVQPSHYSYENFNCAYLVTNSSQPGKWIQTKCTDFKAVLCQTSQNTSTPDKGLSLMSNKCQIKGFDNFIAYRNSCYIVMDNDTDSLSFSDAEKKCQSMHGSHLVSIVGPFEQTFIKYIIKAYGKADNYWIGLQSKVESNVNVSQIFEWTDDWPVYLTDWNKGEPLFPDLPQEECVYMYRENGTWRTTMCDTNLAYICKTTTDKLPDMNSDKSGVCPQPANITDKSLLWVDLDRRNSYCYWFSIDRTGSYYAPGYMSWTDASFHCRRRNGTLASIHSVHELMLIKNKLNMTQKSTYHYNTWIGLSKNYLGEYQWEDGSAVDFTNWDPEEKIVKQTDDLNRDNDRQCVEVTPNGMWKQKACTGSNYNYFVCEVKKIHPSQPTSSTTASPSTTDGSIKVEHSEPSGLSSGAKAGIAFGVIGGVALLLVIAFFSIRHYRPNSTVASFGNSLYRSGRGNKRDSHDTPVAWNRDQQ